MPTVTFVNQNKTIEVEPEANLRHVALDNDIPLYCGIYNLGNCHGNGLCGSDTVEIRPETAVSPPTAKEQGPRKNFPDIRLACQVFITSNCSVVTHCGPNPKPGS